MNAERRIGLTVGLCGMDPRAWRIESEAVVAGVRWVYRRATGWTQTGRKR